jgi:hypothetical protein
MELTQEQLKELFDYHSEGYLIWKKDSGTNKLAGKKAGYTAKNKYVSIRIKRKLLYAHRIIFMMHHGYCPDVIDHIDGDTSNNAIENLRQATQAQNCRNGKVHSDSFTGLKGVTFNKQNGSFDARICVNYKKTHLGCFKTPELAHEAYKKAALELHGEFARF